MTRVAPRVASCTLARFAHCLLLGCWLVVIGDRHLKPSSKGVVMMRVQPQFPGLESPPRLEIPSHQPIGSVKDNIIRRNLLRPVIYVMGRADRRWVKIGGCETAANVPSRLQAVSHKEYLGRFDPYARQPGAFPIKLLALVPFTPPMGAQLWERCHYANLGNLHGVEVPARSHVVRAVAGDLIRHSEWITVGRIPADVGWQDLLEEAIQHAVDRFVASEPQGQQASLDEFLVA